MPNLTPPYWSITEGLPGLDFNRQIVEPNVKEDFPDGGMGIYVDDDFWCVAVLPLEQYRETPIEQIVAEFWPSYVDQATYGPDHGTMEQKLYFANNAVESERLRYDHVQKVCSDLKDELNRLKADRTDLSVRSPTRLEYHHNYFTRQYEHLLIAFAHEGQPMGDMPGVCSQCRLTMSDRVHKKSWIDKHNAGYRPEMEWAGTLGDER